MSTPTMLCNINPIRESKFFTKVEHQHCSISIQTRLKQPLLQRACLYELINLIDIQKIITYTNILGTKSYPYFQQKVVTTKYIERFATSEIFSSEGSTKTSCYIFIFLRHGRRPWSILQSRMMMMMMKNVPCKTSLWTPDRANMESLRKGMSKSLANLSCGQWFRHPRKGFHESTK